jgi:hypothetical protein
VTKDANGRTAYGIALAADNAIEAQQLEGLVQQ